MSMLGDLSEFSLPELLQVFEKSAKTGQLSIWGPNGVHRILFYQGRIVAGISPNPQYSLKHIISKLKSIQLEKKQYANLEEPLGKFLKNNEIVNPAVLALAFRKQVQLAIYPLFNLESGQFRFSNKAPITYEEMTGLSKSSIEIAIEGLRTIQKDQGETLDLPESYSRFKRKNNELPLLKLSSLEWSILENISAAHTLSEISQQLSADLLQVRQACSRLSKVSLIEAIVESKTELNPVASPEIGARPLPIPTVKEKKPKEKSKSLNSKLLNRFASLLKSI